MLPILLTWLALATVMPVLQQEPENVLLIVADDVGVDVLSCYGEGYDPAITPNIDALAHAGVMFRTAYAAPRCTPTRAWIQCGRYGFRTGVGNTTEANHVGLPLSEITIPEVLTLSASGYASAAFGKWHLSDNHNGGPDSPNWAGYSHYSGFTAGRFLPPYSYFHWPCTVDGTTTVVNEYATTRNVDDALDWINQQSSPWFCYLAFNAAHTPIHTPPGGLFTEDIWGGGFLYNWDFLAHFHAMVEAMDTEIGRLLDSLPPAVRAHTTVIFMGDNGTTQTLARGPYESSHSKGSLYEGGIRVPLIISSPQVAKPNREVTALVSTVDLYATVLEIAQVDPWTVLPSGTELDSVSLGAYLKDPNQPPLRDTIFSELFGGPHQPDEMYGKTIRNTKYKLIHLDDGAAEQYYNLNLDPYETNNLLHGTLDSEAELNYQTLEADLYALING